MSGCKMHAVDSDWKFGTNSRIGNYRDTLLAYHMFFNSIS